MHVELVDSLRCPNDHEDTWLVASIVQWSGRHIMRGTLGCPICHASYPVARGTADFTGAVPDDTAGAGEREAPPADEAELLRLAAQLDLEEAGGIVLLAGRYAALASDLEAVTAAHYVAIAGPGEASAMRAPADVLLRVGDRLPLAGGTVRAAAVEGPLLQPLGAGEIPRVLRAGARLVGSATAPVPPGIRELARDEREWVGERVADDTAPVPLQRRR
jgi:hypothetical protein